MSDEPKTKRSRKARPVERIASSAAKPEDQPYFLAFYAEGVPIYGSPDSTHRFTTSAEAERHYRQRHPQEMNDAS